MSDPMDFSWLGKEPRHQCSGRCTHAAGIMQEEKVAKDEGPPVLPPHEGRAASASPAGSAPTLDPESVCEDCACPLKDHMGSKGNCVYCACKVFVSVGPKS